MTESNTFTTGDRVRVYPETPKIRDFYGPGGLGTVEKFFDHDDGYPTAHVRMDRDKQTLGVGAQALEHAEEGE